MSDTREFDIEDTVILMDVSRSMARKDFNPCRIEAVKSALIEWVKLKHEIDKADRFALITFSTAGQVVQDYTNDLDQIKSAIKNVRVHGISALGEGMGFTVQFIGQKMAKAGDSASGGNVNRILIISDGKASLSSIDPIERANVAAELGIITDSIEISKLETRSFGKLLESMAILGEFYNIYDKSLLEVTIKSLSHKKDVFELKKTMPNLALIAADLLDLTSLSEEMQKAVNRLMGVKVNFCEICRSDTCPIDGTTECIRLCPYCKTGMHIHCAEEWAKQSKMIEGGVCRCPHCLFLLKLPIAEKTATTQAPEIKTPSPKPITSQASQLSQTKQPSTPPQQEQQSPLNTAATAKIGDFILENEKIKLKIKHRGEEKFIYIAWDNWGKENYSCNIISGMNNLVCKEFRPIIDWTQGICTGFIIRDLIGWFSSTSVQHGVFIYNIDEFEQWNKRVLKDISKIRQLSVEHPEIKFSSDKIMDFLLEAEVKFAEPLEVSDRNSLEGNLLLGAMTYLNLFESAITVIPKRDREQTEQFKQVITKTEISTTPVQKPIADAKTHPVPPPQPKSELAKRLAKLDKIPISILAEKLGMSNIKVESILIKLIESGELEGTIKKGIFYRKK